MAEDPVLLQHFIACCESILELDIESGHRLAVLRLLAEAYDDLDRALERANQPQYQD